MAFFQQVRLRLLQQESFSGRNILYIRNLTEGQSCDTASQNATSEMNMDIKTT
jgi:hypothetical protein